MDLVDFLRMAVRRWPLVALCVALSAGVAWLSFSNDAAVYGRTLHFVVHPNDSVPPDEIPNAIDVLGQDSSLMQTILGVLESRQTLQEALARAGVDGPAPNIGWTASIRPGSSIIDATVTSTDEDLLPQVASSLTGVAREYVADTYTAYELDFLGAETSTESIGPAIEQRILLAAVLGALVGAGVVFVEVMVRQRAQRRTSERGVSRPQEIATDGSGSNRSPWEGSFEAGDEIA